MWFMYINYVIHFTAAQDNFSSLKAAQASQKIEHPCSRVYTGFGMIHCSPTICNSQGALSDFCSKWDIIGVVYCQW